MIRHLLTLHVILMSIAGFAQPANDNCANAIALTVDAACTAGNTIGATTELGEPSPACWDLLGPENQTLWYTFTTSVAGVYQVSLDNDPNPDSQVQVYSGTCGALTPVACSEDDGVDNSFAAIATVNATALTTYYVQMDLWAVDGGAFCIDVAYVPPPANDDCANAISLTVDAACTTGSNAAASVEIGEPAAACWATVPDQTVWYTFTTGAAGDYRVSLDNLPETDSQVQVLSGACGALTPVTGGCNEDGGTSNLDAAVTTVTLAPLTTYYVQVDVNGSDNGRPFCIEVTRVVTATNDDCANAIALTVDAPCTPGTNVGSSTELGEPPAGSCWLGTGSPDNTVWYTVTPTNTGPHLVSLDNEPDNPDSQVQIFQGTCGSFTEIGCGEDDGTNNTLAAMASATLTAGTTYYIRVDLYGTATGPFCINVDYTPLPENDCIFSAVDITTLIDPVGITNPFDCEYDYVYNRPGTTEDDPTYQPLKNEGVRGCNGLDLLLDTNDVFHDIWFKFTVSSALSPPTILHAFPQGNALLVMGLYEGTPTGVCGTDSISGLTQIDCSAGDVLGAPPGNEAGSGRDEAPCNTPVHPRLNIGLLPAGTYYLRFWDFGGFDPPGNATFNLCAESAIPRPNTSDDCPSGPNTGYMGSDFNASGSWTYNGLSNAGMIGNGYSPATAGENPACTGVRPNEPVLGSTPAGDADEGCTGSYVSYVGGINNIMNVTSIHSFSVNSCLSNLPTCVITFDNVTTGGTPGNVAQVQVMEPGNCSGSTQTIMNFSSDASCFRLRPTGNAPLPNGTYYIVIDGQDGQLIEYDLTIELTYPAPQSPDCPSVLPIDLVYFEAIPMEDVVKTVWSTASEISNDYFTVFRSEDGMTFEEIGRVDGAGNSSEILEYSYKDPDPIRGLSYYKLRQTDEDGTFKDSDLASVYFNPGSSSVVTVHPNPSKDFFNFSVAEVGKYYDLTIASPTGIVVKDVANVRTSVYRLDVSDLDQGVYIYRVLAENGQQHQGRLIVE
ncbi:MAG: T9SS type A sorting domain-containing protein [Flavobacteriales bacterium]|nr:T9SS type A sorting domain-containing protein [Flavobacteriales bacterium]